MEIIKIERNKISDLDLPDSVKDVYYLKNELETVGYGFINYGSLKEIEMFIKEDYRGEEHGKELFKRLYDDFEGDTIHLEVELANYPMIKIIEDFNGVNIGTNDGNTRFIIKKG